MKLSLTIGESKSESSDRLDKSSQYLLAEFGMLHQRATLQEQAIANKVNFFLVITTAIAGGIVVASDIDTFKPLVLPISFMVMLFLLVIGLSTFIQVLDLHASSVFFYRRIGRIRKWFLDNDPSLLPYTPFQVGDDSPAFYVEHARLRGIEVILVLVNSVIAGTLPAILFWLVYPWAAKQPQAVHSWILYLITLGIGLLTFGITWLLQLRRVSLFLQRRDKQELESGKVHFPRETKKK